MSFHRKQREVVAQVNLRVHRARSRSTRGRKATNSTLAGLRIGAYARFSSDKQSATSASAQIARLAQWVQARGGRRSLKHTYRDEGISGATNQRPGLISLMAAVDSGDVDLVVVEDLSRLSRDIEHSASMRKRFAFSG
ncbi:MAG: recombinase family protein, partial [Deltaproteobacteria bacterium]|nr:recombinase family protein [Deltaproteobacteria bacterium]